MLATGVTMRADINGNDDHSEAPIQQQIVSLSNRIVAGNVVGRSVTVVGEGRVQAGGDEVREATLSSSSFDAFGLSLPYNDTRQPSTMHTLIDRNTVKHAA